MNIKREAVLWSMLMTTAVMLGLIVVWGAIVLAFSQTVFTPLYFVAAPYHQDDYSAEGVNAVRFNPVDPALEQEALREDGMRDRLTATIVSPTLQYQSSPTMARSTASKHPSRVLTATIFPVRTTTLRPRATNTLFPTNTTVQTRFNTSTPMLTSTASLESTNTPQVSSTPFSPTNTSEPSNTPKLPNTPKPTNTQKPPDTPKPPNTQKPPNTPPPNTPKPPNTQKPPNTPKPPNTQKPPPNTPKPPKHPKQLRLSEALLILAQANELHIKCNDDPLSCSVARTKWFSLRLWQFI